ncbi:DCN1 4 [Olea europaea subsp. europaea]|uniref:Defective in cullin neddylation protein n=1 Tax=Olea europaea subsp. europaea TaxID=158383 RepID=A0A8S0PLP8_OLEEU|nr:DCN1 4 [Olea europaea subsp. europaea]
MGLEDGGRASGNAASKELERIDQLFYSYSRPEGIESLCSDLEVDHTDFRILMLAWKMQAKRQGYFTFSILLNVYSLLIHDTISKIKKALPELEKEIWIVLGFVTFCLEIRPSNFVDFYSYAFRYCLTEEKQKSIDIECICILLDLVLRSHFRPQADALIQYLKMQNDYRVINLDQLMGFYRFCNEISFPDFSNYDPDLAWPLVLDNFVDWMSVR